MVDATRLFWFWLILRTAVWILAIVASHPNAPLDLVEWLSWGGVWQWGYCKHPPLPAWLADAAASIDPGRVWPVYVLSYCVVASVLIAVWKLAREYLSPPLALAAAVANDGLMYLTNDGAEYSNNIVLDAGWAWLILATHRAVFRRSFAWWCAVGAILGLMLLTKYTIGLPVLVLLVFLAVHRSTRSVWRRPGLYVAAIIALGIVAPHVRWLIEHDFLTMKYAAERSKADGSWLRHITFPFQFLAGQVMLLVPVLAVIWPLVRWKRHREPDSTERRFLLWAILGPFAVLMVLSLTTGVLLRQIWGSPLWPFFGLLLLTFFRRSDAEFRLRWVVIRWAIVFTALLTFTVVKQIAGPKLTGQVERPHFPGRALADEVNRRWEAKYGGRPPIVGGEGWRSGNICCYSAHRPGLYSSGSMQYFEIEPQHSPWTNDADINERGAAFVWDAELMGGDSIDELKRRYPAVEFQPDIELPYGASGVSKTARVGLAFVPPRR